MKLFLSTTSPYARIARIACEEKVGGDIALAFVDPWADPPELLAANPTARVPTLLTDDGVALSETLLIVQWLEINFPLPSLLGRAPVDVLAAAGRAIGVIDAAAHTFMGRRVAADFDETSIGLRRRRAMLEGLCSLERNPPEYKGGCPSIACIAAVVALDYLRFRFPQATWIPALPRLQALGSRLASRPSFYRSIPHDILLASAKESAVAIH
jgi:glutathione S-transferase